MKRNLVPPVLCASALSLILFLSAQVTLQVGYTVMTAQSGNVPVGMALFTFTNSAGVMVSQAGVGAVEPIRSGRIFVDQQGTRTGIAFVNSSGQTISMTLVLRDSSGQEVARETRTFNPREHLAKYIDELFTAVSNFSTGSLTFETGATDQKVAAVTLRQNANLQDEPIFATLPVVDLGSAVSTAQVIFPHIGAGPGLSTQLALISRSNQPISGRIKLFASDGSPLILELNGVLAADFPYQIEPNGVFRGQLNSTGTLGVGYAVVTLEQGDAAPSGSAIFQFTSGNKVISEAGVGAIPSTTSARIFVDHAGTRTGVAIASPGNPATTVTFRLLDRFGNLIETQTRNLPAQGHLSVFVDELFAELPPGFTGLMEISSPVPIVPVTLKLTENQRGELILTTLPVADLTRPPTVTTLIFPQVAFGSGLSTRLILIQTSTTQSASGTLSFFESTGTGMILPMEGQTGSQFNYQIGSGGARQFYPGVTAALAQILVAESDLVVTEGGTGFLRPVTLDQEGNARHDFALAFTSLSPDIVQVNTSGGISGLSRGFSTVTISSGAVVITVTVTVATVSSGAGGFAPTGIAQDLSQKVYVANTQSHTILLAADISQAPQLYAGINQSAGFKDDERLKALFRNPAYIAFNQADGSLYVSDGANQVIRKVDPGSAGRVETVAGSGQTGSQNGAATQATFNNPQGIALDNRGFLWVVDSSNHVVRRINLVSKTVETIAGQAGSSGLADGTGQQARFSAPLGIALETEPLAQQLEREARGDPPPLVSMIVSDTGNRVIRRVFEDGRVETLGSAVPGSLRLKKRGGLSFASPAAKPLIFSSPAGVAVDSFGNIYVGELGTGRVKAVLRNGDIILAAPAGLFSSPRGLAVQQRGRILVAEGNRAIQEIRYAGPSITTVAPAQVSNKGGQLVTLTGNNFARDTLVTIGKAVIRNVTFVNTKTITFTTPPLPSGQITLTMQHRGGLAQTSLLVIPTALDSLSAGQITTIAGGATFAGDGSSATSARLSRPAGVAVDPEGSLYIADALNSRIRKVDAKTAVITTVAGNGEFDFSGDGRLATAASLNSPKAVSVDRFGNVYIADTDNSRIRKVDAIKGTLTTVAGNGNFGFGGDGGSATSAILNRPEDVAVDNDGNLFIADTENHRIRKVNTTTGIISTVAGIGQKGFSGDGGSPGAAALASPRGVAVDKTGSVFIADTENHRIRRVDAAGRAITTVAGIGRAGFSGDKGAPTSATLNSPERITRSVDGDLFIADTGNGRIRRVNVAANVIDTFAGTTPAGFSGDNGQAVSASLNAPLGLSLDASGNLFIADSRNDRIRKVDAKGIISTVAGTGETTALGDGGAATAAGLNFPRGITIDTNGNLLLADTSGHRIRRVRAGVITTVAGTGKAEFSGNNSTATATSLFFPTDITVDSKGNLFLSDTANQRIRRVDAVTSVVTTVAGNGLKGFAADGLQASLTTLGSPSSVVVDSSGNLFIADTDNHRIRRVTANGIIATVAGNGKPGFSGDNGPSTAASLDSPRGVALDASGNLLIADTGNHRIRRLTLSSGIIVTIAGNGKTGFSGDNGAAANASLWSPFGLRADASNNIFIADTLNHRVRRVDVKSSIITTVAGKGQNGFSGDNGPATDALLNFPSAVAFDGAGNLLISDRLNQRIRAVKK